MELEKKLFCAEYTYNIELVNSQINIIQNSKDKEQISLTKNIVFKQMKNIVIKNITNYINLLNGIQYHDIPNKEDLISECYLIFDKCVKRYKLNYDSKSSNFYFFFNKALSRYFFKDYRSILNKYSDDFIRVINDINEAKTHQIDDLTTMLKLLNFSEDEINIINSKVLGENKKKFLNKNENISDIKYTTMLKNIKQKINKLTENKQI